MDRIRFLQYIGARYVPKFYINSQDPDSSEWEPNVDYEYMTWVSLPNGAMYLSKEDVPASVGSPVNNPRYWLTAGQFNAYIQQIQTEINDMKDGTVSGSLQYQINAIIDQINDMNDGTVSGSLQNQINTMNDGNAPGSLRNEIQANARDIATINTTTIPAAIRKFGAWTLERMAEMTVILIGDSWGVTQSGGVNNWCDLITPYFKKVYKAVAGGSSFDVYTGHTYSFKTQLAGVALDPGDVVDAIITIGGANYYEDGWSGAYVDYARTLYPDAEIVIGTNGPLEPSGPFYHRTEQIECEALAKGATVIRHLWQNVYKTPQSNWTSDFYHLLDYTNYVKNILSYLINGEFGVNYDRSGTVSVDTWGLDAIVNCFKDMNYTHYSRVGNKTELALICSKGASFNNANSQFTLTAGTDHLVAILNLPGGIFFPKMPGSGDTLADVGYIVDDNSYYTMFMVGSAANYGGKPRLYIKDKQSGVFNKTDIFSGNVLRLNVAVDSFAFTTPVLNSYINNVISFSGYQNITI